jgi:hypothetical protein
MIDIWETVDLSEILGVGDEWRVREDGVRIVGCLRRDNGTGVGGAKCCDSFLDVSGSKRKVYAFFLLLGTVL